MDRYRLLGMQYRFHDDAAEPAGPRKPEPQADRAPGSEQPPGSRAPDDGIPTDVDPQQS